MYAVACEVICKLKNAAEHAVVPPDPLEGQLLDCMFVPAAPPNLIWVSHIPAAA